MSRVAIGLLLLLAGSPSGQVQADDAPPSLSIADLAAYRAALAPGSGPATAEPVTFRDLWDHPERYQGKPVAVAGRLVRLFRQPGVGQFPPLAEAWVTSPRGEPFCLVFPAEPSAAVPGVGGEVAFRGTFLRQVAYRGGDAERIAPLLVGSSAPTIAPGAGSAGPGGGMLLGDSHERDWLIGFGAAVGVAWILLRRRLARPIAPVEPLGPAPAFVDGPSSGFPDFRDEGDSHDDA